MQPLPADETTDAPLTWWDHVTAFFTNVVDWEVIVSVILIIVATILIRWVLLILLRRVVKRIVTGVKDKQHIQQTSQILVSPLAQARVIQRTRTIGSVMENLITWTLVFIAIGTILAQIGFNVSAIFASAGIIGAALAFGAQNIVKDLLSGMFMVFEDQLGVGDFVDLGSATGVVEAVGVRVTRVRSLDGTLWYVRNGEIVRVGNQSQGWGRAIIEVKVAPDTDVDEVERLLVQAGNEVADMPTMLSKVTGTPELWGIDTLDAGGMVLKLALKTRPAQQAEVSAAMRRRVHDLFAKEGILLFTDLGTTVSLTPDTDAARSGVAPSGERKSGDAARPATGRLRTQPVDLSTRQPDASGDLQSVRPTTGNDTST